MFPALNNREQLLYLSHIGSEYHSYSGQHIVLPLALRLKFAQAMGFNTDDDDAVNQAIFQLDAKPWQSWIANFNVFIQGESEHVDIYLSESEKSTGLNWQITLEHGDDDNDLYRGEFFGNTLAEVGEYLIDGVRYSAHRLNLPSLPQGYHKITVANDQRNLTAALLVAPPRCYEGEPQGKPKRLLGISCQLYTLRSARNWGMGDFTDLAELIWLSASVGIDMICLNPLHAPHLATADFASPYSPSDRRFLNPLYIDAEVVAEFGASKHIASLLSTRSFKQKVTALRSAEYVDYDSVAELKYWVFEALFNEFSTQELAKNTVRAQTFLHFVEAQGEALLTFADIESGQSVAGFVDVGFAAALKASKDPQFHQYLQWIAMEQLESCQQQALDAGMSIGLMGDLAVGAVSEGAEVISKPDLFCTKASIGAPPDPFSEQGQNWNLPPINPIALHRDNYQHFIELIRANMAHCGALRIDHVMGLLRLWWCLPEQGGGAYIYYPLETLLAIIRLESHRNQCLVVGEDMGVVPNEIRQRMKATAVYTNKVFYFERDDQQQFTDPATHPVNALLMVANHDVSTLAGWWNKIDLQLRGDVGNISQQELSQAIAERDSDKKQLLQWLRYQKTLPIEWESDVGLDSPFDILLCGAILQSCARSASRLMSFQLDDLQLIETPVNIPGTYREYPNWRRKQQRHTDAIFNDTQLSAMLNTMAKERAQ